MSLARNTFPKAPDPSYFIRVKDENWILSELFMLAKSPMLPKSYSMDCPCFL